MWHLIHLTVSGEEPGFSGIQLEEEMMLTRPSKSIMVKQLQTKHTHTSHVTAHTYVFNSIGFVGISVTETLLPKCQVEMRLIRKREEKIAGSTVFGRLWKCVCWSRLLYICFLHIIKLNYVLILQLTSAIHVQSLLECTQKKPYHELLLYL